jgi:RNA polymerase sigma factor (TIGR02999 family)
MDVAGQDARPPEITRLLHEASKGQRAAFDRLLPLVYDELKRVARARMRGQRPDHTLTPTALVHEAWLKMVDHTQVEWHSRSHFFAIASRAMRQILIDYAKRRHAVRRGGGAIHMAFDEALDLELHDDGMSDNQAEALVVLDDALSRLAAFDDRGATVVQYRFFGGMAHSEIADVFGVSEITVRRAWAAAKAWLRRELEAGGADSGSLGKGQGST